MVLARGGTRPRQHSHQHKSHATRKAPRTPKTPCRSDLHTPTCDLHKFSSTGWVPELAPADCTPIRPPPHLLPCAHSLGTQISRLAAGTSSHVVAGLSAHHPPERVS